MQQAIEDGRVTDAGTYVVASPNTAYGTLNASVFTVEPVATEDRLMALSDEQKAARLLWATVLETNARPQAQGVLAEREKRCCLGVLCDLAITQGIIESYNAEGVVPTPVLEWIGMSHFSLSLDDDGYDPNAAVTYAGYNDQYNALSFKQIAAKVRESV